MNTTNIKGGSSMSVSSNMHAGMSRKNPRNKGDSSRKLPSGPSTAAEATRSGVAPTPRTLGPREA